VGVALKVFSATVVLAVAALAATACTGASASKVAPTAAPNGLPFYYAQKAVWHDCGGGFQCSTVQVPLDYAKPAAPIKLALIRLPASGAKIGSLLTNPGGPGGSGVDFVRETASQFDSKLRQHFDIVGFDPRGVGASSPVRCLAPRELDRYFSTDTSPTTPAQENTLVAVSKEFAAGCSTRSASLLPYVGTISAAKDMDILRAAVGDKGLTYYGASYGTYLGAYYADLFPTKVRAMVLDGALDPKMPADQVNIQQSEGFETALRSFAADCIRLSDCPLGTRSVASAVGRVRTLFAQSEKTPLKNGTGDGRRIDSALVALGVASALYSRQEWQVLRLALTRAISEKDGTLLLKLGDLLVERNADGSYSNQSEANMAVNCVDKPYARDLGSWEKEAAQAKKVAPEFGQFVVWGTLPCAYWPVPADEQPRALTAAGSKPIVVVGTTRDPATPYQWAKNLASELSAGVLLSLDGDGHTAYLQGNPCITSAVDTYLNTGTPPKPGTLCH
jgi:pimeloyl-ACP methyl ester carboxylesterase